MVQLVGITPPAAQEVTFELESAGGSVTTSEPLNAQGEASFRWTGAAGTGTTTITAAAVVGDRTVRRVIEVKPSLPAGTQRSLLLVTDPVVYGYEDRQISGPVTVRVANEGNTCENNVVVFRPYGTVGSGSPDTVRAAIDPLYGGCTASTYWRFGKGVGQQHLRASLADEPAKSLILNGVARALPRLSPGIAFTYDFRDFRTANISERNVQVTRRYTSSSGADSLVVVDSIVKSVSLGKQDEGWAVRPVLNVDFPITARLTRLRASLGAALRDADQDWYVGFSAIQPFRGVSQEAVGADFHTVVHFGRRDVLANPQCADDRNLDDCRSKSKFFFPLGIGMMATFDATQLFSLIGSLIQ
ncbi:MAG TPA: hypothetical protein VEY93_12000 [Longimicrobium sp.]|nr:hypothetical protein [Longimicrobium sp.]